MTSSLRLLIRILLSVAVCTFIFGQATAQNFKTGGGHTYLENGNFGLGVSAPQAKLHIQGKSGQRGILLDLINNPGGPNSPFLIFDARLGGASVLYGIRQERSKLMFRTYSDYWQNNQDILTFDADWGQGVGLGIGNPNPKATLHIGSSWTFNDGVHKTIGYNFISGNSDKYLGNGRATQLTFHNDGHISFRTSGMGTTGQNVKWRDGIFLHSDGNVGIGTARPKAKLSVDGQVAAYELKVNVKKGADFVFQPSYRLPDLSEVESFIKKNQHLPGVASADEMVAEGLKVGEFQILLLQKIEELTLHTIRQQKEIEALKEKLAETEGK